MRVCACSADEAVTIAGDDREQDRVRRAGAAADAASTARRCRWARPKQRAACSPMLVINRSRPVANRRADRPPRGSSARRRNRAPACTPTSPTSAGCSAASASAPARHWRAHHPGYRLDGRPTPPATSADSSLGKTAGVQAAAAGTLRAGQPRTCPTALAEWRGPVLEDLRDFQFVDAFATALDRGQGARTHRAAPRPRSHAGVAMPSSANSSP